MGKFFVLCSFFALSHLHAQECTHQWDTYFETDPLVSKWFSGDTSAAYAVFSFHGNPNVAFEIRGHFPKGRFMSFESHNTKLSKNEDGLLDYDIEPDQGSSNPFLEGVPLEVEERSYTLFVTQMKKENERNVLGLPKGRLTQSLLYRAFSPNEGVTLTREDLPRIFARNAKTGEPVSCPRPASYSYRFNFPQLPFNLFADAKPTDFKEPEKLKIAGLNKGAGYLYSIRSIPLGNVALIRFKAPTFANTRTGTGLFPVGSDVRYWSFCTLNFAANQTLNCLPDFLISTRSDGFVYLAVGRGSEIQKAAQDLGYTFLPDYRSEKQHSMQLVYRNLVPTQEFRASKMFKEDYYPELLECTADGFVAGTCGF